LPADLADAARVDGVSEIGIFFGIMAPLAAPAFVTIALFNVESAWNGFIWPLVATSAAFLHAGGADRNGHLQKYVDGLIAGTRTIRCHGQRRTVPRLAQGAPADTPAVLRARFAVLGVEGSPHADAPGGSPCLDGE